MAKQTYTSGQVLTAAQMTTLQTNDFNQTVSTKTASYTLVAADVGTKIVMNSASATTITVNTSLFTAGDTLQLLNIGAGVCTITAGTATVSSSGSLALSLNSGGKLYFTSAGVSVFEANGVANSGLVYIAEASSSSVSSISFDNCFSSTYLNYRIIGNVTVSEFTNNLGLRYRLAGSDNSTSNYTWVANNLSSSAGTPSTATVGGQAQTIGYLAKKSLTADHRTGFVIDIFNPFSATGHKSLTFQSNNVSVPLDLWQGGIALAATGAFDGFSLVSQSGSMSISAKVYGYRQA